MQVSEGKTTATVDLDIPDVKKATAKKAAPVTKSLAMDVADAKKTGVTSKDAISKDVTKKLPDDVKVATATKESKDAKDGGKKAGAEASTHQKSKDASSYLKPPSSELLKSSHVDVDSRREKDEVNIEIRTKPVFGRRSKFSEIFISFSRITPIGFATCKKYGQKKLRRS